jgi:hypothetical protein
MFISMSIGLEYDVPQAAKLGLGLGLLSAELRPSRRLRKILLDVSFRAAISAPRPGTCTPAWWHGKERTAFLSD